MSDVIYSCPNGHGSFQSPGKCPICGEELQDEMVPEGWSRHAVPNEEEDEQS